MQASAYLEGLIAAWLRGTAFPSPPTALELALSSSAPGDAGSGISEPSGGSYTRQEFTFAPPVSSESSGSVTSNSAPIIFAGMPASSVSYGAVFDDSGNMLLHGELRVTRTVAAGDTISFAENTINLAIRGRFSAYLAEAIIEWMRGDPMVTPPVTTSVGLSKTTILRDGSNFTPPLGGTAYAAQVIEFDAPVHTLGVGTAVSNTTPIIFGPATAYWGIITSAAIMDESNNALFVGALSSPKEVKTGEGIGFNAGTVKVTVR